MLRVALSGNTGTSTKGAPMHVNTMHNIQYIVLYLHDIVYPEILVTTCWISNPLVHIEVILYYARIVQAEGNSSRLASLNFMYSYCNYSQPL